MKIGMPIVKLSHTPAKNSNPKRTYKLDGTAYEAMKERYSNDPDLDRTRTRNNGYIGPHIYARDLIADMDARASAYDADRRAHGRRAMNKTAATGWSMVIKPGGDEFDELNPVEKQKFWADALDALSENPYLQQTLIGGVIQRDEGREHMHLFGGLVVGGPSMDDVVNQQLYRWLNTVYPEKMRELGWDVENCEPDPEKQTEPHGVDALTYKRRMADKLLSQNQRDAEAIAQAQKDMETRESHARARETIAISREAWACKKEAEVAQRVEELNEWTAKHKHVEDEQKARQRSQDSTQVYLDQRAEELARREKEASEAAQMALDAIEFCNQLKLDAEKKKQLEAMERQVTAATQPEHNPVHTKAQHAADMSSRRLMDKFADMTARAQRQQRANISGLSRLEENLEAEKRRRSRDSDQRDF